MTVDIGRIYDNKEVVPDVIRIINSGQVSKRTANLDYWLKDIAPYSIATMVPT